jgi:hypothetical protein
LRAQRRHDRNNGDAQHYRPNVEED